MAALMFSMLGFSLPAACAGVVLLLLLLLLLLLVLLLLLLLMAACAGSVKNASTAFPRGMLMAVVLVILNYVSFVTCDV
jgi:hypothetical protein